MYQFRKMILADVDAVYAIEVNAFSEPWSREAMVEEVSNEKAIYLVCERQGEIVGYSGLWQIFDEGHITNIAVRSDARRQGIGQGLIHEMVRVAKDQGVVSFTLEVRKSNVAAKALYEKLGFESAGLRKGFYSKPKEDAYIMWRHEEDR